MTPYILQSVNPELFREVHKAFDLIVPQIMPHVVATLKGSSPGDIAVHGSFIRIEKDDTKELLFIQLEMYFVKLPKFGSVKMFEPEAVARMRLIHFYDTIEEYEEARLKVIKESEERFGKDFPSSMNFNGKNISK